jgi:hypothetical protein
VTTGEGGLGPYLVAQLVGDATPPTTIPDLVRAINHHHGGGRAAARSLGIPETTWRNWGHGRRIPSGSRADLVTAGWRRMALDPGRPGDDAVVLKVQQRDGNKVRSRTIGAGRLRLAPGTMDKAAAVYVQTGDPDKVARTFLAGVCDAWYKAMLIRGIAEAGDGYRYDTAGRKPGTLGGMTVA